MTQLIRLLKSNARLSNSDIATMLGVTETAVANEIEALEKSGVIKGYTAIVDEEMTDKDSITAYIELSVTPKAQVGYDEIARHIADYDEVESISLMSGGYDLAVTVRCRNIKEVSMFVAQRLATIRRSYIHLHSLLPPEIQGKRNPACRRIARRTRKGIVS